MTDHENPLEGLRPIRVPDELSGPVIAAARAALAAKASRTTLDRIWESRPMRLAWAASILALLVGHLVLTALPDAPSAAAGAGRLAGTGNDEDLRDILQLPLTDRFAVGPEEDQPAEDSTEKGARS